MKKQEKTLIVFLLSLLAVYSIFIAIQNSSKESIPLPILIIIILAVYITLVVYLIRKDNEVQRGSVNGAGSLKWWVLGLALFLIGLVAFAVSVNYDMAHPSASAHMPNWYDYASFWTMFIGGFILFCQFYYMIRNWLRAKYYD